MPAPLIAIAALTIFAVATGLSLPTVGHEAHGAPVEITGLNARSGELHRTLSGKLAGAHG